MTKPTENTPAKVPATATQAGSIHARWSWSAPTAWTERMLTALEQGVKGGVWFSLIDKVHSEKHLHHAAQKVMGNKGVPGVDHVTVEMFDKDLLPNLRKVSAELRDGTYRPQAIRRTMIPKLGSNELRPLGIPTVRDRVVQNALRLVLEPIFERDFAQHSYGFRPKRGCQDALKRVQELLEAGYSCVLDVDLKSYFDTIPHGPLMDLIRQKVADGRVLKLIEEFLKAGVMDGLREWTPEQGAPQGAVVSPLLSNIYLNPLDHLMAQHGIEMVRYADDFVIMCRTQAEAEKALAMVQNWTAQAGLTLHPTKTRIVHADTGFDFLGYHFERGMKWPRQKSLDKFRATIRKKTRRTSGNSLTFIIADVNSTVRGWHVYFRNSIPNVFDRLDQWIRMRLRSILRKRLGLRGRERGTDHQRWPNKYFAEMGLFSLKQAHLSDRQSSLR